MAADMVKQLDEKYPVILLADRGYETYNLFAHVEERLFDYVIRIKDFNSNGILSGIDFPDEDEFDITAWDLYRAGYEIGALTLHNTYTVRDTKLDITVAARLTKQEYDYDDILNSECTFTVKTEKESSVSGFIQNSSI